MLKRLAWLAVLVCMPLYGAENATLARLAQAPYWLALVHYTPAKLGGWRSYVTEPRFFLAANGAHDPEAELRATLAALYAPATEGDQHAQCRYPARTRWLKAQLQLNDLPTVNCAELHQWFSEVAPHSTVLVFPAAYLNSPSSMFGHTLLRIDQASTRADGTALLSYAINFGAYVQPGDNSMLYAWKGLAGGYPGLFSLVPYQQKIAEYGSLENRDLWEYTLNLTPEETARMVEHVWELREIRFDYYFFDENCSYRLLELLQIARPSLQLTAQFPLTAIPTDTVKAVRDAGLVASTAYRPSRERELLARAHTLSPDERRHARAIADGTAPPAPGQAAVNDTAYRLERYRATGQARDPASVQRSFALLQAINANPPAALALERPPQPEQGHPSRTWSVAAGNRDGRGFAEYGLRMAYHDLLDNNPGFPLGAQIEILGLKLRQYEGNQWQLQRLDLANIRSLTPRGELLQPLSWQVGGGLERVPGKHGKQVLATQLGGGAGGSWEVGGNTLLYALGTGRIEHNPDFAAFASPAVGWDAGALWRNPLGNFSAEAKTDYFANGEVRQRLSLGQQWELSRTLGLRLSAARDFSHLGGAQNEVLLEARWYHY